MIIDTTLTKTERQINRVAQPLVEPIRRALEYAAIGRRFLMIDELPQGALARYSTAKPQPTEINYHQRIIELHDKQVISIKTLLEGMGLT